SLAFIDIVLFFFHAEDGIRDDLVTGVQTCALPICGDPRRAATTVSGSQVEGTYGIAVVSTREPDTVVAARRGSPLLVAVGAGEKIGRASWRASEGGCGR